MIKEEVEVQKSCDHAIAQPIAMLSEKYATLIQT